MGSPGFSQKSDTDPIIIPVDRVYAYRVFHFKCLPVSEKCDKICKIDSKIDKSRSFDPRTKQLAALKEPYYFEVHQISGIFSDLARETVKITQTRQ